MLLGAFCADTANVWYVLGWVVTLIKIIIPLILIIMGMVDLGKAVVSSDDKQISKSVSSLIKRFIAAIVLFFIPTIVNAVFSAIGAVSLSEGSDYLVCVRCISGGECPERNSVSGDILGK